MKVELRRFDDDGNVITVGTITSDGNSIVGDTRLAKRVVEEPIGPKQLTAKDGEAFLQELHTELNGSYLWATKPE